MPDVKKPAAPGGSKIEILSIRETPSAAKEVRGFMDIKAGPILVRSCKIVDRGGGSLILTMPSESWKTAKGEFRYRTLVEFDKHVHQRIEDIALAAWANRKCAASL